MIEGYNFAKLDLFSPSDPYLLLKCGTTTYNEREYWQLDCDCPKFHKCFVFQVDFPGSPVLDITAMDYDDFFGDDTIGSTKIDLDDRFYAQNW